MATACGWQQAGTWNISFAFQPISVSPPPAAATNGDQVIYAFTTSTAFGTVQFFDHGCALTYFGDNNIVLDPDLASSLAGNVPMDGTLGSGPLLANSQCTLVWPTRQPRCRAPRLL